MIKNTTLTNKLALIVIPVVLGLSLMLLVLFLSIIKSNHNENTARVLTAQVTSAVNKLDSLYERATSNAKMIYTQRELGLIFDDHKVLEKDSIVALKNRFSDLKDSSPQYLATYVVNSYGNVLYYDNGKPFYDIEFAQQLSGYALQSNTRNTGSKPESNMVYSKQGWVWLLSIPVSYRDKSGYVIVVMDAQFVRRSVASMERVFVDFSGVDDEGLMTPMARAMARSSRGSEGSVSDVEIDGVNYRYSYVTTPYGVVYGWINIDGYGGSWGKMLPIIAVSIFLLCVSVAWVWLGLNRIVVIPVKRLLQVLNDVLNDKGANTNLNVGTEEFRLIGDKIQQINASLQHHNTHIERLAYYDELTQLHNKQYIMSYLDQKLEDDLRQGTNLYAWVVDIKGFKRINSTHGHRVGDEVLCSVAAKVRCTVESFCRRYQIDANSMLVSRGASDEFVIMGVVDYKGDLGEPLATSIKNAIESPLSISGHNFSLHVVVGFAKSAEDPAEIYQHADIARHEVKQKGTGVLRYTSALKKKTRQNQAMVDNICKGLEMGEFVLYYQPKLNLKHNSATSFEALIRWPTENGFVSPGVFIPFAETAGLIAEIDMYVMKKIVNDVSILESLGWSGFSVSFNISALRLMDVNFINAIKKTIFEKNVKPQHIQIEITEHSLIDNIAESIDAIDNLKNMGISVALDDFGTGHSSLAYLKDLPIDVLKIDRTFIHNVNNEEQKKVLLSHIVKIGQSLSMSIVAEGVETADESAIVKELGCEELQGYYFQRPIPFTDMIDEFGRDNKKE